MYSPAPFANNDKSAALDFVGRFPLATLVTQTEGEIQVTHLPLVLDPAAGEKVVLLGHLSRANSHWRSFQRSSCLAVFLGPQAYISPQWYEKEDVPTWNYSVVHMRGALELIEEGEELIRCLQILVEHAEAHWPSGWTFSLPPEYPPSKLNQMIIGFRLQVEELEYKQKLSQNRSEGDHSAVVAGLKGREDHLSLLLAEEMQRSKIKGIRK